jgi:hypothetical protein
MRTSLTSFRWGIFRGYNILDIVDLETDPWVRETTGMWFDVPKDILQLLFSKRIAAAAAIHSAEHAFLNRFALARDLLTECKVPEKEWKHTPSQRKRPARCARTDIVRLFWSGVEILTLAFAASFSMILSERVVASQPKLLIMVKSRHPITFC